MDQQYEPNYNIGRPSIPVADLAGFSENDLARLRAWQCRLMLAAKGWMTATRFSANSDGSWSWAIWARHINWHGTLCEVRLRASRSVGRDPWLDPSAAIDALTSISRDILNKARTAWEQFPTSVPCQLPNGELVENSLETPSFLAFPQSVYGGSVVLPERSLPTEALPGWPGYSSMAEFLSADNCDGAEYGREVLRLAELGIDWDDSLDPLYSNASWTYLERKWQLRSTIMLTRWHGQRLDVRKSDGLRLKTPDLSSFGAAQMVKSIADTVERWRNLYPDENAGLPPGCVAAAPPLPVSEDDPEP
jgi:hypothetical protein